MADAIHFLEMQIPTPWACKHRIEYEMGGSILCKTVNNKDLGITMNTNLKVS